MICQAESPLCVRAARELHISGKLCPSRLSCLNAFSVFGHGRRLWLCKLRKLCKLCKLKKDPE